MSEVSAKYAGPALAMVASAIAIVLVRNKLRSRHPPYPPGPQRYPIIGNLLDFPRNPIWEGFSRMAQEHDTDILHLDMMGSHLVVLNSSNVAIDLLERRSVMYSDRPRMPMVNELMGCSWSFPLMQYGNTWRTHRRLFHRFFNVSVVDQFDDKIYKAVNTFLLRLSQSPERFLKHVHFLTVSLTFSMSYGMDIESDSDVFYGAAEDATSAVDVALMPRAFLVDAFPILKYVPEWFPGAGFKRFANKAKKNLDNLISLPFQHVKTSFEAGVVTAPSLVASSFEELPDLARDGVDEDVIRGVGGTIFLGGGETTSSAVKSFFLAATMHPEIVRLAQQELDEVLGGERLPDFLDKPRLPYISAIVKEVLRWRPPNPLGTPHRLMEDDVYEGWFIPAGTTVIDNPWSVLRNESVYPSASVFNPNRFLKDGQLNPEVRDPEQLIFGWGRRACPGRFFALRVLWLTIARTLATFDISKSLDEDGKSIVPEGKFTYGLISIYSNPLPFRSDIKLRSSQALSLIAGH